MRAGDAQTGGTAYPVSPDALDVVACYPVGGDPTVVEARVDGQRIVFLGSSAPLENDQLAKAGNAALALNLLGQHARVVWHVPSLGRPARGQSRPASGSWCPAGSRRCSCRSVWPWSSSPCGGAGGSGRSSPSPCPSWCGPPRRPRVADGCTGGRAPATVPRPALRAATRARTSPLVGLPTRFDPAALTTAVAGRTGRPSAEVNALLYGGPPPDDAALVRLADDLDALERQVRHP